MNSRRLLSSLATASICFSMMQPAFAATTRATSTDEVLIELQAFNPDTVCAERSGKDLGRCIGDVIKRIGSLRNDFVQAERTERDAWLAANAMLGVGAEYRVALQTYLNSVRTKRAEFTKIQRELEKTFFAARKQALLDNSNTGESSTTPVVTVNVMEDATARCAKQSNSRSLRVCLRQQLRLLNPKTRLLNVSPTGTRSGQ